MKHLCGSFESQSLSWSGRTQSPSATIFKKKLFMPKTYQHLQLEERALIQTILEQGFKAAAIALSLGRSRSTISRELARNNYTAPAMPRPVGRPFLASGYRCVRANQRARALSCTQNEATRLAHLAHGS